MQAIYAMILALSAAANRVGAYAVEPSAHSKPVIVVRLGFGLAKPPYVLESGKEGVEPEIAGQALATADYKMIAM